MGKQSTFPVIQELHIKWICAQLGNPRRKDCRVVGPLKYYKGGVAAHVRPISYYVIYQP